MANASEEKWISMFRLYMEGGAVVSVLQNAGTEVFEFSRIRVYVRAQEIRLTRYLNMSSVRSGDKPFGCKCYKWWKGRPWEVGPIEQEVGTAVCLFFFSGSGRVCVTGIEEPAWSSW